MTEDLPPLLKLMREKPKKPAEAPPAAVPEAGNGSTRPYPELNFRPKTQGVETEKEDERKIAKLFKRGKNGKPMPETFDFGDPDKWGDVYQTPAIYDAIKGIVELNATIKTNGDYDGPILVELKDGRKFFSDGFKNEQTCYELDTKLGLLEIKAQYWQ